LVTIYDIAKQANVSAMTVSRVINNSGRISEHTRTKVMNVMQEMNYVPNSVARSLVKQKSMILSLLIPDIANPFFTTLARGAEDMAKNGGYKLLFGNSDEDYVKEREYVEMIVSTRVGGVLLAPAGDQSLQNLQFLEQHNVPYVMLDREVPGIRADQVVGDSKAGAMKLMEHLIHLGHRRIALINGHSDVSTARLRYAGYVDSLAQYHIPYDPQLVITTGFKSSAQFPELESLLLNPDAPTALFAANNFIAIEVMRTLRKLNIQVPEQISVVSFDDMGEHLTLDPFLTAVTQPAYQFGNLGMNLLLERIQGAERPTHEQIVLQSQLIVRNSTRPPPLLAKKG
jgi:LacI family transcriptional regulator